MRSCVILPVIVVEITNDGTCLRFAIADWSVAGFLLTHIKNDLCLLKPELKLLDCLY
jgi:hypothetical protein